MREIYIFRHGETDWNKLGRLQGHTDIPLNETGQRQAAALYEKFKNIKVDSIFSSDLTRALNTAKIALPSREIQISKALREVNIGDFEGLYKHELPSSFNLDAWLSPTENIHFPNGESKDQHRERLKEEIESILNITNGSLAISTHGGSIARVLELCPNYKENIIIENCALIKLHYHQNEQALSFQNFL